MRRGKTKRRPPGWRAAERIGEELDLPKIVMPDVAHIELSGNREAIIDGCKGVLDYDDQSIRLNTGRTIVRFTGSDLTMRALTLEQAVISGTILSIDFLN